MSSMEVIGRTDWGGRVIKVWIPLQVVELANEIAGKVEAGEMKEEGEAKELWLSKVHPHIERALGRYQLDPVRDIVHLHAAESISTLKRPQLVRPSGPLNRAQRRTSSLLRGRAQS